MCVLGFCVFGAVFGVLGGCLWGVFFVFWRVSGVLFCWGGGFWVDFLFGRCGSICLFCFLGVGVGVLCGRAGFVWCVWVLCTGWVVCLCSAVMVLLLVWVTLYRDCSLLFLRMTASACG